MEMLLKWCFHALSPCRGAAVSDRGCRINGYIKFSIATTPSTIRRVVSSFGHTYVHLLEHDPLSSLRIEYLYRFFKSSNEKLLAQPFSR